MTDPLPPRDDAPLATGTAAGGDLTDARLDPGGLIAEAYRIDGIGPAECRSIFLDWALKQPPDSDPRIAIAALLARHGAAVPDHPMTVVLTEGLAPPPPPRRRARRTP
jgi:hypothetical protein